MWNDISSEQDLSVLMETVCDFHDSCQELVKVSKRRATGNGKPYPKRKTPK